MSAEIIELNCELYDVDNIVDYREGCRWVITEYTSGDYEGSGQAVAMYDDDKIYIFGLGHCSCYGPTENLDPEVYPVEDFLKRMDHALFPVSGELLKQIKLKLNISG